ncbi:unnamed protein product [Peniophora sp. CBMAI 1063]|nr:unnamed protein product [Peniophora sp. CBMAI 1063]
MDDIVQSSNRFAEDLRALLDRRRASLRAQTSGFHRGSTLSTSLLDGLLSDARLLEDAASTLKGDYNAQPGSLNAMPPEILHHIFTLVAETERPIPPFNLARLAARHSYDREHGTAPDDGDDEHEDALGDAEEPSWMSGRGGNLGWISLGHVCRLWRNISLSLSQLWARDVGALPGALRTMLDRAGDARPITLRLYGATFRRDDPEQELWDTIAQDEGALCQRICQLHLVESRIGHVEAIYFPRLSHYTFTTLDSLVISAHELLTDSIPTIDTPVLRVADLTNVICLFTSNVLSDLSIRGTEPLYNSNGDRWQILPHTLFALLEAHKHTLLHLHLDVGIIFGQDSPDEPLIKFSNLRSLNYRGILETSPTSRWVYLMAHMMYPAFTSVYVRTGSIIPLYIASRLVAPIKAMMRLEPTTPLGLSIEEHSPSETSADASLILRFYALTDELELYTGPPVCAESFTFGGGDLHLTLHIDRFHEHVRPLLEALSASISAESVKALSYFSSCRTCRDDAVGILQRFPFVKTLHLVDPCSCGAVMHSLHQPGLDGPRVPKLERLVLSQRSHDHVLSLNLLAQQLRARYGHPNTMVNRIAYAPLKALLIDRSVIVADEEGSDDVIHRIASRVELVLWKGKRIQVR